MTDRIGVIITAGGSSSRFGSDKLCARLGDRSVLRRSIDAFAGVGPIVVAVPTSLAADSPLARERASIEVDLPDVRFARVGGDSRARTVLNAIARVDTDWIAVHDGARPLVDGALIARVIAAAREHGAAAPAAAVTSTIKLAGRQLPSLVERTVPRATLWAMQTPQIVRRADMLDAYARCPAALADVTDEAQLLELAGYPVMLVRGDDRNLKITTPTDLALARVLLEG